MPSRRSAFLAVPLLLATVLPVAASPAGQVSLFAAGLDPFSKTTALRPGVGLKLGTGGGVGGTLTVLWTDRLATGFSVGAIRLPLSLSGTAAGSADGGSVDLIPLTVLGERRYEHHGRTQGWVGVGVTLPFVSRASLSPALRRTGFDRIRRPDHPALALATGMDLALSPRASLALDLRWSPVAETLVVIPAGATVKSQQLGIDFRPVTLSAGLAWRAF
jgi:outer membrane protein W